LSFQGTKGRRVSVPLAKTGKGKGWNNQKDISTNTVVKAKDEVTKEDIDWIFGQVKNTGARLRNNSLQISQKSYESAPTIAGWLKKFFVFIFFSKPKLIYPILKNMKKLVALLKGKLLKIEWKSVQWPRLTPAPQKTQNPEEMCQKPLALSQPQLIQIKEESQSQEAENKRWNIDPILINQSKNSQKSISNPVILDPRLQYPLTKILENPPKIDLEQQQEDLEESPQKDSLAKDIIIPEPTPTKDQPITIVLEEDNSVEAQFTTDSMESANQEIPTPMEPPDKELGLESILMTEEETSATQISNSLQVYSMNHFSQEFLDNKLRSHPSRIKSYLATPIGVG